MFFKTKDEAKKYEQTTWERAYASTPKEYHCFLQPIVQKAKIAGGSEIYISLPYMTVDGRIRWAWDEHRAHEKKLHIKTRLCQIADRLFVEAEVESELLGSATGKAEVQFAEKGVNATNPFENAETSAVGRALGNLGYGLIGTGLASADEVADARAREALEHKVTPIREKQTQGTLVSKEPDTIIIEGHILNINERVSSKGTRYLAVAVKTTKGSEVTVYFPEGDFDVDELFLNMKPGDSIVIEAKEEQNVLIALLWKGVA